MDVVREIAGKLLEYWKSKRLIIKKTVPDVYRNRLIQAFGRAQDLQRASEAFRQRSPFSSAVFGAFARACLACGHPEAALPLWDEMHKKGLDVDSICFSALCRACGETGDLGTTHKLLAAVTEEEQKTNERPTLSFRPSDLQCAQLIKALCLRASSDDVTFEIGGKGGDTAIDLLDEAYTILELIVRRGIPIDNPHGHIALLKGCANRAALSMGRKVHAHLLQHGSPLLQKDPVLLAALISMYVKCADLDEGRKVFEEAIEHGVSPTVEMWTAVIQGMALFGYATEALGFFKRMQKEGGETKPVAPNGVTFVALLMACSHAVRPDDALALIDMMKGKYGIEPTTQHYTCVVDALGRANRVQEAYELIVSMPPLREDAVAWQALLACCTRLQDRS